MKAIRLDPKAQGSSKEVSIMSSIEHPHLIRYHKSFVEEEQLYILMDYAEEGDLQKLIERQKLRKRYFAEKDLWSFAW